MRTNELQFHSSFSISASCMTQSLTCVCAVQDKYNGLSFTMERPRGCPCPFLCWPFNCTIINPLKMFVRSTDGECLHPPCIITPQLWLCYASTCGTNSSAVCMTLGNIGRNVPVQSMTHLSVAFPEECFTADILVSIVEPGQQAGRLCRHDNCCLNLLTLSMVAARLAANVPLSGEC